MLTGFSDHRVHIKNSMAVLLNVPLMCAGVRCYDKCVCVRVRVRACVCGVRIVGCV